MNGKINSQAVQQSDYTGVAGVLNVDPWLLTDTNSSSSKITSRPELISPAVFIFDAYNQIISALRLSKDLLPSIGN